MVEASGAALVVVAAAAVAAVAVAAVAVAAAAVVVAAAVVALPETVGLTRGPLVPAGLT